MRADNSRHLVAAARQRSTATRERAVRALRLIDTTGRPVTLDAIAQESGVSRSWLYRQPDLRAEIDRLRAKSGEPANVPKRQRASDASLRQRLLIAHERIRALAAENRELRDRLAAALGELRARR